MRFGLRPDDARKTVADRKRPGFQADAVSGLVYAGILGLIFVVAFLKQPQQPAVADRADGSGDIADHTQGPSSFKCGDADIVGDRRIVGPIVLFAVGFVPRRHHQVGVLIADGAGGAGLRGKNHGPVLRKPDGRHIFAHLMAEIADIRIAGIVAADGQPRIIPVESQAGPVFHSGGIILLADNPPLVGYAGGVAQNRDIVVIRNFLIDLGIDIVNAHYRIPLLLLLLHKIIFDHQPTCLFPETSLLFSPSPSKRSVIKTDYVNNRIIYCSAKVNAF